MDISNYLWRSTIHLWRSTVYVWISTIVYEDPQMQYVDIHKYWTKSLMAFHTSILSVSPFALGRLALTLFPSTSTSPSALTTQCLQVSLVEVAKCGCQGSAGNQKLVMSACDDANMHTRPAAVFAQIDRLSLTTWSSRHDQKWLSIYLRFTNYYLLKNQEEGLWMIQYHESQYGSDW